jgi:alpha-glucosidase (family GH31 glycosyl hydrolase)
MSLIETQYWLGDALLVGGVFEAKAETSKVYLPKDDSNLDLQFLDLNNAPQTYYAAGQWVDVPAKWTESIPVLAKVGSAIPVGRSEQVLAVGDISNPANLPLDDYRAVEIFPPKGLSEGKAFTNVWYEDDGVSPPPAKISVFEVKYQTTESEVLVEYSEKLQPGFVPHWKDLGIVLPAGDERSVKLNGKAAEKGSKDGKGRAHYKGAIERK